MSPLLYQSLSLAGAVLVLIAYAGQQFFGMRPASLTYGLLNLAGSVLIAATALAPLNAGVLLLESAWAAISLGAVVRCMRSRRPAPGEAPPGPR